MPFIKSHLKQIFNVFVALCVLFGLVNIVSGVVLLTNYFTIQGQIAMSAQYLNQSVQSSQAVLQNASLFTHNTTIDLSTGARNVTSLLKNLSSNITTISEIFASEANYFNSLNVPGDEQQLDQISGTFGNISTQLNYTRTKAIPRLIRLVNQSELQITPPLENINSSTAALSKSITALLENAAVEVNTAGEGASLALLVFSIYLIIEGVIFLLFGILLRYI